ncbi:hypothetical protein D3C84_586550 [compost metagenome]
MAAGLQGHIGGGAPRLRAGLAQRMHLGVRLTGAHMPAFADDLTVAGDDAADPWIRVGGIQPLAGQLQGAGHAGMIEARHGCFAGSRDSRSISSRNSLRS